MKKKSYQFLMYPCALLLFFNCTTEEFDENIVPQGRLKVHSETVKEQAVDFLDYGVYWFNAENDPTKAYDEKNNRKIEVPISFYDPSKPTVIYFHGWQLGKAEENYKRGTFQFIDEANGIDVNTAEIWKNKGWNIGIFYWNQFADEFELKDAEAKIWSVDGNQGMRYRLNDSSYSEVQSPKNAMGIEAYNQLSSILASNTSNNIRFVGHSLGNQLATYTAFLFSKGAEKGHLSSSIVPNRLELIDPFWSKGAKEYLEDYDNDGNNDWPGERVRFYINEMIDQNSLAVTWYKSSLILNVNIGDSNESLKDITAFQSERYWYVSSVNIPKKHSHARHTYFWSMNFDAPDEVTIGWWNRRSYSGNAAASASTSTERIKSMMGSTYLWDQVEGRYTPTPADNEFERK